jgi:RNA polymerase sigma factor (sigma-70 family)
MTRSSSSPRIEALLRHSEWIEGLARAITTDRHTAEDALQDTWIAALEGRMTTTESPRNWLATVLRNFVRRNQGREGARARRERRAARPEVADSAGEPAEIVVRADTQRRLIANVVALEEPYRSTLLLHFMDGLSAEEIARRQNIPSSTVRSHLRRALVKVRRRLGIDAREGIGDSLRSAIATPLLGRLAPFRESIGGVLMSKGTKLAIGAVIAVGASAVIWYEVHAAGSRPAVGAAEVSEAIALAAPGGGETEGAEEFAVVERNEASTRAPVPSSDSNPAPSTPADAADSGPFRRAVRVLDPAGEPLPDAEVELTAPDEDNTKHLTDGFGECGLLHEAGTVQVQAFMQGVGLMRSPVVFSAAAEAEVFELRLIEPTFVHGLVLEVDGNPAPGVSVYPRLGGFALTGHGFPFASDPVVTDAEGRFELMLDPRSVTRLQARRAPEKTHSVTVRPEATELDVVLRFPGRLSIEGVVLLPDRSPASGSFAILHKPQGKSEAIYELQEVGEDGRFSFALPGMNTYTVRARSQEASPTSEVITVNEARPQHEIELLLESPEVIEGSVGWTDGSPAAGCRIAAWIAEEVSDPFGYPQEEAETWWYHGFVATDADENGGFRLSPLRRGASYAIAFVPDPTDRAARVTRLTVPAGTDGWRVVLTEEELRGAFLFGRITGPGGEAVEHPHYVLQTRQSNGVWAGINVTNLIDPWRALPFDGGEYHLSHLEPGREYQVDIRADGLGARRFGPWIAVVTGTEWNVELGPPTRLTIQVVDAAGLPSTRARVFLTNPLGTLDLWNLPAEAIFTDELGESHYENIMPSTYRASVVPTGGGVDTSLEELHDIEVPAGRETHRVVITLSG